MSSRLPMAGAVMLAIAMAAQPVAAQDVRRDVPRREITVTGEGMVSVAPDFARLHAGVVSEAKSAREAADINRRTMIEVVAAIKAAGIPDKDVQTQRYAIQPVYGGSGAASGGNRLNGFRATNTVVLTVRDLDKLADVIDRLAGAGANSLDGLEFGVSDRSQALDKARADAVADARRKAELYARAAGVTLGPPVMIIETGASPPRPLMRAAVAAPTPIATGEITLRVSITASFELQR